MYSTDEALRQRIERQSLLADASHAAALAVDDHPTRPGTATKTPRKTATKARPAAGRGRATGSDRGHDGR